MPCGSASGYWARAFPVPNIGIPAILLDGTDMRSPVSMGKAALGRTGSIRFDHCCDGLLGRSDFCRFPLPGRSIRKDRKRRAAKTDLLSARYIDLLVSSVLYADAEVSVYKSRSGYHAGLSDPRANRAVLKRTGHSVALPLANNCRNSVCGI